jgi:tRNA threonylcarbamoyladenosine biosynthesis protein TsaE
MKKEICSRSPEETKTLAAEVAQRLTGGEVIGLVGQLGMGKTCFVKGLAQGLGIAEEEVYSPSFTIIAEHYPGRLPLFHIDLYRLEGKEVGELGLEEYLYDRGVAVVEWFDYLPAGLVEEYLRVTLLGGMGEERRIVMEAVGERYGRLLETLP